MYIKWNSSDGGHGSSGNVDGHINREKEKERKRSGNISFCAILAYVRACVCACLPACMGARQRIDGDGKNVFYSKMNSVSCVCGRS